MAEKIPRFAIQGPAQGFQGGKPDAPYMSALEEGKLGQAQSDFLGQRCEAAATFHQKAVQMYCDGHAFN